MIDLPLDLLLDIFSRYLSNKQLVVCARASKLWYYAAVTVLYDQPQFDTLTSFNKFLETIVQDKFGYGVECVHVFNSLSTPLLSQFLDSSKLLTLVGHATQLRSLHLADCSFLDDLTWINMTLLLPNLEDIDLSNCWRLTDASLVCSMQLYPYRWKTCVFKGLLALSNETLINLGHFQRIFYLDVSGCFKMDEHGLLAFLNQASPSFRGIKFSGLDRIGMHGFQVISELLSSFPMLEILGMQCPHRDAKLKKTIQFKNSIGSPFNGLPMPLMNHLSHLEIHDVELFPTSHCTAPLTSLVLSGVLSSSLIDQFTNLSGLKNLVLNHRGRTPLEPFLINLASKPFAQSLSHLGIHRINNHDLLSISELKMTNLSLLDCERLSCQVIQQVCRCLLLNSLKLDRLVSQEAAILHNWILLGENNLLTKKDRIWMMPLPSLTAHDDPIYSFDLSDKILGHFLLMPFV